ncbi:MAG: DUF1330 domain-containing protein [Rhodospirillaceae bacterium]|jgi:uncharacterized protein (DUF1330 family)|nr:DUF1330 domain-containing protein [Rhodospirillaceae bacterium]
MAAYVAIEVKLKNPEKLKAYSQAAGKTVTTHGGNFSIRAAFVEALAGNADYDRFVMIEFPDTEAARTWYQSPEYQALIPMREEGADMTFSLIEG